VSWSVVALNCKAEVRRQGGLWFLLITICCLLFKKGQENGENSKKKGHERERERVTKIRRKRCRTLITWGEIIYNKGTATKKNTPCTMIRHQMHSRPAKQKLGRGQSTATFPPKIAKGKSAALQIIMHILLRVGKVR